MISSTLDFTRLLPLALCVAMAVSVIACSDDVVEQQPTPTSTLAMSAVTTATATGTVIASTPMPRPTATSSPTISGATAMPAATAPTPTRVIPTAIPSPAVPTSAETVATVDDRRGGTLNLVSRQAISHLDVQADVSAALAAWGPGIVYSRLMRFSSVDGVELPSLAVECELCTGWQTSDGFSFDFALRDDVLWQDLPPVNARHLIADDIAFSYERQRSGSMPNGALLHIVDTVYAVGEDSLHISLRAPDADFLSALANGSSKIVAREAVELNGSLRGGPTIGTGAWILEEARDDLTFTLRRNESYFKAGAPLLDRIVVHTIADEDTAYAAFRVNNVDVHRLRPEQWEEFAQQKPDAKMLAFREIGVGLEVAFNTTAPPFDDVRVRRAAMLAMRPNRAIDEIWQSAAYLTQGVPLGRADWQLRDDEVAAYFDDHVGGRQLLIQAVDSLPVPVVISVGDFGAEYRQHAERIATEMQSVGFDATLKIVDRRRFGEQVWLGGDYRMFVGPTAPIGTPNGYMLAVLSSAGAWNTTGHADDALDALILAQAGEYDTDERRELVLEAQRLALDGAYRFMPAAAVSLWAWWPQVQGFQPNFAGSEYSHWERVWLDD